MNFAHTLDSAIAQFFPAWGANRAVNRLKFQQVAYAAAEKGRIARDWSTRTFTADEAIIPDQSTINARARLACRDDWAARSIVRAYRRHVVGTGITARACAQDEKRNLLDQFNQDVDRAWKDWSTEAELVDAEGRKSLSGVQAVIVSEWIKVGETFVVFRGANRTDMNPLTLQVIPPERLATQLFKTKSGNQIKNGVEVDANGHTVAIWIDGANEPVRVGSDQFIHFFMQDEPLQTRGVSELASVLVKMRHLQTYDEYQLVRARYEAAVMATIETKQDSGEQVGAFPSVTPIEAASTPGGAVEFSIEPGLITELPAGKVMNFHTPTVPGGTYDPFVKKQIGMIAAGAGLDYSVISRDFTGGTFSSQRQGLIELHKETDTLQAMLIDLVMRPIRNRFIALEVASGRLDAPGFFKSQAARRRFLKTNWKTPAKPWIDPSKTSSANDTDLKNGSVTMEELWDLKGGDWRDAIRERAAEQRFAESQGVTLPQFAPQLAPSPPAP